MASRKRFETDKVLSTLRNIPDNLSACENSGSEFDAYILLS